MEISRTAEAVTWRALGWKDEEQDGDADALIPNATDFVFDAAAYDSVLNQARTTFRRGWCFRGRWRWRPPAVSGVTNVPQIDTTSVSVPTFV